MRKSQESCWIPLLMRCYRLSLVAYPASFREHYANDMVQVFRDCSSDAYRQQQTRGLFLLCLYTLTDLIITAGRERLSNFGSRPHVHGSTKMPYSITDSDYPFAERLTEVLEREPAYYALLIHMNASRGQHRCRQPGLRWRSNRSCDNLRALPRAYP